MRNDIHVSADGKNLLQNIITKMISLLFLLMITNIPLKMNNLGFEVSSMEQRGIEFLLFHFQGCSELVFIS